MDDTRLVEKVSHAAAVTEEFVVLLRNLKLSSLANNYASLIPLLVAGDAAGSLELFKRLRYAGPGSLSDVLLEEPEQSSLYKVWGSHSTAMNSIRLYVEFGIDRKDGSGEV